MSDHSPGPPSNHPASWILNAEVTEGTTFAFDDEFFLPEGSSMPEAIVAGSSSGDDALYFDPTPRADIPAPSRRSQFEQRLN